jgi:CheY-like chemotaxis protein/anti-sigma regulatory factor (Ser/Thr protein kinase)/HPt (histidine-containing phosphotransfer) domain-containing protein
MEIIPNKYDTPNLINDTVQLGRLRYESKPIEFILQVEENTPSKLIGDELRIRQILNNLLSNAFKYTEEGEVRMSISSEPEHNDETVTLVIQVSDTGQGMTKEQTDKIFGEYLRFNMEKNHGISGTGLGLNITKRLIDMMDGDISVESEADKGSVFTVRLPQKDCGAVICGADMAKRLGNFSFSNNNITKMAQVAHDYMPYGRVLVVDDVESNLFVAKGMLVPYGLHIQTAKNGFDAIEKIKNGEVYDIVFMDHMMPVMDGIEATKASRQSGYNQPIVALTANAMSGQSEMFLSNGFDRFISKPIDSRELDLILTELIHDKQPAEIIEAAQREKYKEVKQPKVDLDELKKYSVMDAEDAVKVLESIYDRLDHIDDADIKSYTTSVHGIKSALMNIGEANLSELAFRLEKAGEARDIGIIAEQTPAFLTELKALTEKLKPKGKAKTFETSHEDMLYFKEKLNVLKTACEDYNIRTAETVLSDLKQKNWSQKIDDDINELSVSLLLGDFEKVVSVAERIMDTPN